MLQSLGATIEESQSYPRPEPQRAERARRALPASTLGGSTYIVFDLAREPEAAPLTLDPLAPALFRYRTHQTHARKPRVDFMPGSYSRGLQIHEEQEQRIPERCGSEVSDEIDGVTLGANPSLVSTIYLLLGEQQLGKARQLLACAPLEPEYAALRRLLALPSVKRAQRRDRARTLEFAWLRAHAAEYPGRWLAVDGDTLLAVEDTMAALRERLKQVGDARKPLLYFVEPV